MLRFPAHALRAAAIAIPALLAATIVLPAHAQVSVSISFDNFHSRLAPYGTWSNNPRWGEVWRPSAARGFRPYYNGHWEDTREYGWLWISEDSWGDIPYHYGRWVSDPREGWLWVPGYVWGPSWVVWRSGGGNIGWFPMPPGDDYYGSGAYRGNFDNEYGYRDWYGASFSNDQFLSLWIFVGEDHFRDRNFRNYAVPQRDYGRFISQTRDSTNYVTVNNYVVNRSVDSARLQRNTNQRFQPVSAASVIGNDAFVTQATVGRQIQQNERRQHPIPVNINPAERSGRGGANSNAIQQPNPDLAPQGSGARRNGPNGADLPKPQAGGDAAEVPTIGTQRPNGGRQGNANQTDQGSRANPNSNVNRPDVSQAPQTRGAPAQNEKAIVEEARPSPRAQEKVPVPNAPVDSRGDPGNGQARSDKQGDTKNNEDKKARGNDRGPN